MYERLRGILLSTWDPLGIGANPNLADEYDRYIPALISLLRQNAGRDAIAAALKKIESDELEVRSPSPGLEKAATAIWSMRSLASTLRVVKPS
jgi:hypothetical protein